MSQIDFANLTSEYPRLQTAWEFMSTWLADHPRVKQIELDRLATDGSEVDAWKIAAAIDVLLDKGLFHRLIGFKDYDGTLLKAYDEDATIPERIPTRDNSQYIPREELNISEVYEVLGR